MDLGWARATRCVEENGGSGLNLLDGRGSAVRQKEEGEKISPKSNHNSLSPLSLFSPFRSYRSPRNYQTPRTYRSPRAEDARVTYGGGDSGPGGNGGGNGGGGGRGGGGNGRGRGRGFGGEPWSLITIAAAALVAAGGGMAYKKKGSRASLEAGAALGGVLLAAASLQTGAATRGAGLALALLCSSALAAYMSKNFARTGRAWPHGVLAGFGLVLSGGYVSALSGL